MSIFGKKIGNNSGNGAFGILHRKSTVSTAKLTLTKATDSLEQHIISLKKKGVNLDTHKARVFVVLDISGSMRSLICDGTVQKTLSMLLPLALKFDDNGKLESYVFNRSFARLEPITLDNYEDYVKNTIIRNHFPSGGTSYAPVLNATVSDYKDTDLPAFGIFITDGENTDISATNDIIRLSSEYKIFYQFVGIGLEKFKYLQKLDDLSGRKVDNTAFVTVRDLANLTDDELYDKILEQYPTWLSAIGLS